MKSKIIVTVGLLTLLFSLSSCGANGGSTDRSSNVTSSTSYPTYVNVALYIDEYSTSQPFEEVVYSGVEKVVHYENRPGYAFIGYFTERNGAGEQLTRSSGWNCYLKAGLTLANHTSLYGYYEIATYRVTYTCSIGIPTGENPTTFTKDSPDLTLYPYEATGYTFGGWYESPGFEPETLVPLIRHGSTHDYYLYGKMERNVVTISLDTIKVIQVRYYVGDDLFLSEQVRENDIVNPPSENPSQTGQVFLGWYYDAEFTTRCEFNHAFSGDVSLYAKFANNSDHYPQMDFNTRTAINAPLVGYSTYIVVSQTNQEVKLFFSSGHLVYTLTSFSLPLIPSKWANTDSGNVETLSQGTVYYLTVREDSDQKEDYYLTITGDTNYNSIADVAALPDSAPLYQISLTFGLPFRLPLPDFDSNWKTFLGWYTLANGQGEAITDALGNSLNDSAFLADQTLYPYLKAK